MEDMLNLKRFFVPERATVGIMADIETTPHGDQGYEMIEAPTMQGGVSTFEYDCERTLRASPWKGSYSSYVRRYEACYVYRATLARGYSPPQHVVSEEEATASMRFTAQRKAEGGPWGVTVSCDMTMICRCLRTRYSTHTVIVSLK